MTTPRTALLSLAICAGIVLVVIGAGALFTLGYLSSEQVDGIVVLALLGAIAGTAVVLRRLLFRNSSGGRKPHSRRTSHSC